MTVQESTAGGLIDMANFAFRNHGWHGGSCQNSGLLGERYTWFGRLIEVELGSGTKYQSFPIQ